MLQTCSAQRICEFEQYSTEMSAQFDASVSDNMNGEREADVIDSASRGAMSDRLSIEIEMTHIHIIYFFEVKIGSPRAATKNPHF